MTDPDDEALGAIAFALDMPAETDTAALVQRIEAMRLVREAGSLAQVRRVLVLAAEASPIACAGELCRRLPPDWHYTAVLAMQVVEMKERERVLRVGELTRDALMAAERGSAV